MSPPRSVLRTFSATLALAQLVLLTSCTGGTLAGKNGLSAPERTLVLADAALPGSIVGTPAIPEFVAQVTRRSHGKLKVEVRTRARDTDEQRRVIQRVAAGRVDLGWAEAHTFDTLGVTSLRPLLVPLLIDSYQLQAQVLRRHSAQLLADVPAKTGVIPLALLAGGLRFAAATDHPIVTAADWSGRAFSTTSPGSQEAGIRALGATPVIDPRDRQTLTQSGLIDSGESTWRAHPETLPYVAPNVRLWPRAVVLLANPQTWRDLSPQQRGWLHGAAASAAAWAVRHAADSDATGLQNACRSGSKAALASSTELDAMRTAGLRAIRHQRQPSWIDELVHEVNALRDKAGSDPTVTIPGGCTFVAGDARPRGVGHRGPLTGPGPTGALPLGTYRYSMTEADMSRASGGKATAEFLQENAGLWTWTIGNGRWSLEQRPADSTFPVVPCSGWISVSADVATFTRTVNGLPGGDCVPFVWSARFHLLRNGAVRWTETDVADFSWVFQATDWTKIR
jgi:TRAP-type C4-dicarboxylate transport system substrate-binding protein